MNQARNWRMGILAARIGHFPGSGVGFFDARNDLPANGTIFISRIDQVEKVWRDSERELVVGQSCAGKLLWCESRHEALKLLDGGDPMLKLPAPVVPIRIGNTAPKTAAGGTELFERI